MSCGFAIRLQYFWMKLMTMIWRRMSLIDLRSNKQLNINFDAMDISTFWCEVAATHPTLSKRAWSVLVPFATTFLCESGFYTMVQIKDKYCNRLDISHDMGVHHQICRCLGVNEFKKVGNHCPRAFIALI